MPVPTLHNQYEEEAIKWARRINDDSLGRLSLKEATSLASDVRLAPQVWLEAFYAHDGDKAIFQQLQVSQLEKTRDAATTAVNCQLVDCLKSLMNLE